ncbi:BAR domain-containing protein [Mycena indigotica]|uniref:BAR domain-containing protein n=1 Tax=Mycena indigotica TaxID=2126181 RepID=A0A8H6WIV8_9AGAR|nr:BAR domain-containing protein [Mycena indigotica]KAF7316533.1 BAR domain-containing protein [Mycena indigotica]
MASKQLGKLRQWAGEVISTSKDKTTVSDEFKELEKDVERRRDGAHRLVWSCTPSIVTYSAPRLFLASEAYHRALSKRKDNAALDDSEKLLPIETLGIVMVIHGEEFGEDSPFGGALVSLGRAQCKIAKFQESYAQSFADNFMSSLTRFADDVKEYEALRKKLDSRRLSYDAAISKYEKLKNGKKDKDRERRDAEEDMNHAKMRYEETTDEVEAHMHAIQENETGQLRELGAFLTLQINFVEQYLETLKETKDNWPGDKHTPSFPRQKPSTPRRKSSTPAPAPPPRPSSSSEDESERTPSRPPSRPASRSSRKRSDSTGTAGGDKRRLSVAGWASTAVGSVTGRGRKNKDKDAFASLTDDPDRDSSGPGGESDSSGIAGLGRRKSASSTKGQTTPKLPSRILKPPSASLANRKTVRALYDFSGGSDELSFNVGDTIIVINEVLDGWWMGELNGKQGLFPTPYTEPISSDVPPLPRRPNGLGLNLESEDDNPETEDDYEHYGRPMAVLSPTTSSPFYGGSDAASIVSSVADDDEKTPFSPPPMPRRSTTSDLAGGKKAPPPPPRRSATAMTTASPRIPERRPGSRPPSASGFGSVGRSGGGYLSASASSESSGYDRSPFDSATELSEAYGPSANGCADFKQNPFKPKGMCSNCFELHA